MRFVMTALIGLVGSAAAGADQLVLSDGSRLSGTVAGVSDAAIEFDTAYAGTINVRIAAVEGISTDAPRMVVLESGDRILGRLVWDRDTGQRLDSRLAGMIELDGTAIVGIEPEDSPSDPVVAAREQAAREIEAMEQKHAAELAAARAAAEPVAERVWSGEVSLAVNGASGNTDEFSANPQFSALRETGFDRLSLGLRGRFASQDGEETENEIVGNIGLEHDISPRWFLLGAVRLERDEFEDLDLRANIDLGAGYFVFRREHLEFKPRIGFGLQTEAFSNAENEEDFVAVAGWDFRNDLGRRWRLTHTVDYRPTFSDPTGSYRAESKAALTTMLTDETPWMLRFQVRNEFDADPEPGIEELDTIYSVGIQRVFD